jgi:hypothetical protein
MKKFLCSLFVYCSIVFLLLAAGFLLPDTPRSKTSLLYGKVNKDLLLENTPSPRIIFVGGSNLSFGLNSSMIKDSLGLNPINTAIHASLGLIYMLDSSLPHIRRGDIVVVVPEYAQYFGDIAYGREELLRTSWGIDGLKGFASLNAKQLYNVVPLIPKYIFSKFSLAEHQKFKPNPVYSSNSFNKYGDAYKHWTMQAKKVKPFKKLPKELNEDVIVALKKYRSSIQNKGAYLFLSYPSCQASSFDISKTAISSIEKVLKYNKFNLLGYPERYRMPDSLMFDTPYHLSKKGVDTRTKLLIEDTKSFLLPLDGERVPRVSFKPALQRTIL